MKKILVSKILSRLNWFHATRVPSLYIEELVEHFERERDSEDLIKLEAQQHLKSTKEVP